jgi:hypothetical protein
VGVLGLQLAQAQTKKIVKKYLQAVGGKEAWLAIHTRYDSVRWRAIEDIENPKKLGKEKLKACYKKKPKMAKTIHYEDSTPSFFYYCNGVDVYNNDPYTDRMLKVPKKYSQKLIQLLFLSPVHRLLEAKRVRYVGKDTVNAQTCFVLELTPKHPQAPKMRYYIDTQSYLLLKSHIVNTGKGQKMTYGKYARYKKLANGLVVPFLHTTYNAQHQVIIRNELIKVEFNLPLQDHLFNPLK